MIILRQNKMRKHNDFLWARQGNLSKHYFFSLSQTLGSVGRTSKCKPNGEISTFQTTNVIRVSGLRLGIVQGLVQNQVKNSQNDTNVELIDNMT